MVDRNPGTDSNLRRPQGRRGWDCVHRVASNVSGNSFGAIVQTPCGKTTSDKATGDKTARLTIRKNRPSRKEDPLRRTTTGRPRPNCELEFELPLGMLLTKKRR